MNRFAMLLVAASTSVAVPAIAQAAAPAAPQHPIPGNVYCGGPPAANTVVPANDVSACEVNKVLVDAGNALQMIRNRQLLFGLLPRTVMVGIGTVTDLENPNAQPIQNARWEYAPDFRQAAVRWDIKPGGMITDYEAPATTQGRIVRVVKADKAWNEGPMPGMNPMDVTDAATVALRRTLAWVSPHAVIRAAAFTSKGLCPTGGAANNPPKCPDNKVSIDGKTINLTLYGSTYKVTLNDRNQVATIETTVRGMPLVTTYSNYRDGKGMSGGPNPGADLVGTNRGDTLDELAFATDVLDKYRYGTFFPGRIVQTLGGREVTNVEIKAAYSNKYVIFPDPAVVRAAGAPPR